MTRKLLALLIVTSMLGLSTTGCFVHEKEKVKEVKVKDNGDTRTTTTIDRT
jgi:hypothetical protein